MLAVAIINGILVPWLRGDGVDVGWILGNQEILNQVSTVLMGLLGGLLGLVARDNKVTSEQALGDSNASAKAAEELRKAGI